MDELSPYCARLRSKKLCFAERPPRVEADVVNGSGRVWCQRTMSAIGPDGALVDAADCDRARACFVPFGSAHAPAP